MSAHTNSFLARVKQQPTLSFQQSVRIGKLNDGDEILFEDDGKPRLRGVIKVDPDSKKGLIYIDSKTLPSFQKFALEGLKHGDEPTMSSSKINRWWSFVLTALHLSHIKENSIKVGDVLVYFQLLE